MYSKLYNLLPVAFLLKFNGFSEQSVASRSGISRLTLRSMLRATKDTRLGTWERVARALDRRIGLVWENDETHSDFSVQGASHRVLRDGPDSWKIHFMDFVDELRRTRDTRLIVLPPLGDLPTRLRALLASIVAALCAESRIDTPPWAGRTYRLDEPWFISGSEALKAMTLRDSPLEFRRNQIFVGEDFLKRA